MALGAAPRGVPAIRGPRFPDAEERRLALHRHPADHRDELGPRGPRARARGDSPGGRPRAAPLRGPARRRALPRPDRALRVERVRRPEHGNARRRSRGRDREGRRRGRADPDHVPIGGRIGRPGPVPARAHPRGRALPGIRDPGVRRRGPVSHQRSDRDRPRRRRTARALCPATGESGRVPRPHARGAAVAREPLHVAQPRIRRGARARRHLRPARRRGRRVHAERTLRGPGRAAPRQPHGGRPRQAALREPRAVQGRPRRRGARSVPRQGHRAAGRAEDRRRSDQQEPAPLAAGARQLHARRSRSWPTTSSASTARRPGSSTPRPSSTCARAGSAKRRRARC